MAPWCLHYKFQTLNMGQRYFLSKLLSSFYLPAPLHSHHRLWVNRTASLHTLPSSHLHSFAFSITVADNFLASLICLGNCYSYSKYNSGFIPFLVAFLDSPLKSEFKSSSDKNLRFLLFFKKSNNLLAVPGLSCSMQGLQFWFWLTESLVAAYEHEYVGSCSLIRDLCQPS